ncbi:hypothetical protein C8R44DRAFT_735349 [Mycena epipterygia]|nr:hypothetical protein C8R44DRAFT_735349 [Mycena epipterygia]
MFEAGGLSPLVEANAVIVHDLSARIAARYVSLKKYLQNARGITKSISKCRKEVEDIHTSTLRIIEEERRRKLFEAMKEVTTCTLPLPVTAPSPAQVFFPRNPICEQRT